MKRMVFVCSVTGLLAASGVLRAQEAPAPASPADGFVVHVTAPHVVNGEVMGPFHHYCKPISPEPVIQCILFETTDAAAPMVEVEYIVAKSVTRDLIDREEWNEAWHDHAVEIASGRVQIYLSVPRSGPVHLSVRRGALLAIRSRWINKSVPGL